MRCDAVVSTNDGARSIDRVRARARARDFKKFDRPFVFVRPRSVTNDDVVDDD